MRPVDGGLSGGADARRCRARLRVRRSLVGRDGFGAAGRAAGPCVRRHVQRGADCDPAVRVHGRDARTLRPSRGLVGNHGPAVRRARRGACDRGRARGRAARRRQRDRGRDGRHHGPDRAADDAAPRLRPAAGGRDGGGNRDAGADFSPCDGADPARRSDQQRVCGGAARQRFVCAAAGHGERSLRRLRLFRRSGLCCSTSSI